MRRIRGLRRLVPLVASLVVLAACGGPAGSDPITLTATFDDAGALMVSHHVRAGDVPIGTVTAVELTEDMRAQVTMQVRSDTGLPADTQAVLGRTSLLGEMFIDLRPTGEGGTLADGTHIDDVHVVTEFEQLVASGDHALSELAVDHVTATLQTGAVAFGERGDLLGRFLEDLNAFVGGYNARSEDLVAMIDALEGFAAAMAPDAEANAESLAVLERASQVLEEEDDRLIDALADLDELATVGERILSQHRDAIHDNLRRLRLVLEEFTRVEGALAELLVWLPRHNIHVPNGVIFEQASGYHLAQVWLDFIVCGVNETEGDPTRTCEPPNPGERADPPEGVQFRSEECYDDLRVCREETDRDKGRS